MKQQDSTPLADNAEMLAGQVYLLNEAAIGHLENLLCPKCSKRSVSVWFTHPLHDTYRTWFVCDHCEFHTRAQNTERPHFFSEDRFRPDLDQIDQSIMSRALFRKPPERGGNSQ